MKIPSSIVRSQLQLLKPFVTGCSYEAARKTQDAIGLLMSVAYIKEMKYENVAFDSFSACMITPKKKLGDGIVLYIHGGGYVCGDLEYAKGFGSTLSKWTGLCTFCPAYRLAPESKFPAALDDVFESYNYLLNNGYKPSQIVLCGESAGGGLVFALCALIKNKKLDMPAGVLALSPWTDLTMSGASFERNAEVDPSMTKARLEFFAECYSENRVDPLVSPLYADVRGFPPSMIFVGGDEVMMDDAVGMYDKLCDNGCVSTLTVAHNMWHAYVLYNLDERKNDRIKIINFISGVLSCEREN